ncbi:MAG: polysaccharide biosynthesis protein, partial [Thiobacillus sp.]
LNHFVGAAAVTIYDLAMKVIWGIQYLFSASMRVFLHMGSQDKDAIWPTFSRVIALIGIPVMILHVVGALFLSWVAHHWLMISARELMLFFAIATLSNLGMIYIMPLYISLIGRGDLLFIFRSQAILAMTNVVVTLALLPFMSLLGAAFGLLSATIYNVIAIYGRCKAYSITFERPEKVPIGRQITYAMTALLFGAAILLGIKGGDNFVGVLAVLLVLAAITVREPIVEILLIRAGLKS